MRPSLPTLFVALVALLCASSSVYAEQVEPASSAEDHSKRGVELYAEGKLPEAVSEMLKAYELAPEPGLLYNIARIYQKMGQRDLALHYLKQFVTQPGADPDRVQKALKHLEELNRATNDLQVRPTPSVDPPDKVEGASPPAPVSPVATPSPQAPDATDHTLSWALMGSGGAVLIVGGVLGGLALSASATLEDPDASYAEKRDAQDATRSLALGSDLSIGLGAATALVGLVLFFTSDADSPPTALLTPSVGPHHAGAQMTLRFP